MRAASIGVLLSALWLITVPVWSTVYCDTTSDCQRILPTPGVTVCENGQCTNPFQQGCLKARGETHGKKNITRFKHLFDNMRVCNSDDEFSGDFSKCRIPDWAKYVDYDEIRIGNGNHGTSVYLSWIFQIILTEILEVPSTIEQGFNSSNGDGSFYNRIPDFVYGNHGDQHETDKLVEANRVNGDCRKSSVPCAHMIPDMSDHEGIQHNTLKYGKNASFIWNDIVLVHFLFQFLCISSYATR